MKIAVVFDGLQIGGVERVGIDYIKLLQQLGHTVDVYNLNPTLTVMEKELPENCKVYHKRFSRKLAPEQYAQLVKRNRWGKYIYPIIYILLSLFSEFYRHTFSSRKKYDIAIAFSGHFNDLTYVANGLVRSEKKMCWLHGALYGYILISDGFLHLYKKINNLVVLVDEAQEEVFFTNRDLELNISKMYNPTFISDRIIDENEVKRLKDEYGEFILMVARFSYPHKDHYTVINAFKILVEKYQHLGKIVFVGEGPEEESVRSYCKNLEEGVRSNIVFAGSQSEIQNFYVASYILVHASIAGEGLPTVMLEAMAYGKPMVVTDSKVGPREILGNSRYGLLCNIKDPEDMAEKINQLLSDKECYNHYKESGAIRLRDFEPHTIKKQFEEVLSQLV